MACIHVPFGNKKILGHWVCSLPGRRVNRSDPVPTLIYIYIAKLNVYFNFFTNLNSI